MGDYKNAIETLEKAAKINDQISGRHSLELAKCLNNLGLTKLIFAFLQIILFNDNILFILFSVMLLRVGQL